MGQIETLWERIRQGVEDGLDAAIATVHHITEKAGEGIEATRLRRERARIEAQSGRVLAELGGKVYERCKEEMPPPLAELGLEELVARLRELDERLEAIDRRLEELGSGKA
ncbi:MAG: hypothetical protein KatS3mg121_0251 [Gammaproteobacteria bacterium]|nr:MAG: hypothetical protein KatS3mg121_0251 [Gammaproteobacteria bacterium]